MGFQGEPQDKIIIIKMYVWRIKDKRMLKQ